MTDLAALRAQAADGRRAASNGQASALRSAPTDRPTTPDVRFASELRATTVNKDGMEWVQLDGYASTFERGYDMWDSFGPYTEVVSAGAADVTLAASPEVVWRFNHAGTPMASTRNGRLELWADGTGLGTRALVNPKRADVQLLLQAIQDEDVREQSFMFQITEGTWSPDYSEFRITSFNLERGDVGPVTYGANPHTSVAQRSGEFLALIPNMSQVVAREALTLLSARADIGVRPSGPLVVPEPVREAPRPVPVATPTKDGRSISMLRTRLMIQDDDD